MQLLAHPFRLGPDGSVATIAQDTDAETDQTIQLIIGTRLFERPMCWSFGTPDPVFAAVTAGAIQAPLDAFGPPGTRITQVTAEPHADDTSTVIVVWDQP